MPGYIYACLLATHIPEMKFSRGSN